MMRVATSSLNAAAFWLLVTSVALGQETGQPIPVEIGVGDQSGVNAKNPKIAVSSDDAIERFDAVELNKQLIGNEIRADELKDRTIELTGQFYGSKIVKPANGNPPEAFLVTFQGYAGLGECMHIKCFFLKNGDLVRLRPGDPIKVRGKVSVKRDVIGIAAKLVD